MKPMLAAVLESSATLCYPALASPKLDGVRCLIINGVATSRSLKPIPNAYVQRLFGDKRLNGLDGELIVGPATAEDAYRRTTSGVMRADLQPDVHFFVFDNYLCDAPFQKRLAEAYRQVIKHHTSFASVVAHAEVRSEVDLNLYEAERLAEGYEGVMLRDPSGPYKEGRSTAKEGFLLKLKRFQDAEARVVGVEQMMQNTNAPKKNALGHTERSSHKAGKKAMPLLGGLVVRDMETGVEFTIGTGFTLADRAKLWKERRGLAGRLLKYKSQPTGVKDKPRFPVFLGWRDGRDT